MGSGPGEDPGWSQGASSFNWTREILRAERTPFELVTTELAGLSEVIEVELGQCFRSFPALDGPDVGALRDALEVRGVRVSVAGLSLDDYHAADRRRSEPERLAFLEPQLRAAHRLGAYGVRVPFGQPGPELIAAAEPLLEELDLILFQEIQGHQGPGRPGYDETIATLLDRANPRLRLILDTSMVTPRLPVTYLEQLAGSGVPADLVDLVTRAWGEPGTLDVVRGLLAEGGVPGPAMALYVTMVVRFGTWRVADLAPLMPYVGGVHLKFWDLDDADGRVSGPIREVGALLARSGFTGNICSEWGGHDWYTGPLTAAEITRRHLDLSRSLLSAGDSAPTGAAPQPTPSGAAAPGGGGASAAATTVGRD